MTFIEERKVRSFSKRKGLWLKIPASIVQRRNIDEGDTVFWSGSGWRTHISFYPSTSNKEDE